MQKLSFLCFLKLFVGDIEATLYGHKCSCSSLSSAIVQTPLVMSGIETRLDIRQEMEIETHCAVWSLYTVLQANHEEGRGETGKKEM